MAGKDSILKMPIKSCLEVVSTNPAASTLKTQPAKVQKRGTQTLVSSSNSKSNGQQPEVKSAVNSTRANELSVQRAKPSVPKKQKQRKTKPSALELVKTLSDPKVPLSPVKSKALSYIAELILQNRCRKIIVMAGAGISTSSGIPDFRTPGSGLYDNLQKFNIPYPEAIFDIDFFTHNPKPFFALAKELYPGKYKPNIVHYFVKLLNDKGLLLRCYTQNIDGLERLAGIPPNKLVEAHGTFSTASCHLCYSPFPVMEARNCILNGGSPRCRRCYGVVKPDVVFFGEDLPKRFKKCSKDFPKADLLIVMGTSLEVAPFANIVDTLPPNVPRLLLNRDLVGPFTKKPLKSTDVAALGELNDLTRRLVHYLHWQDEMDKVLKPHKSKDAS